MSGLMARARSLATSPGAVYLGAAVLSRLGAIVLVPLYTRTLELDEYGRYALFTSMLGVMPHCLSLGLNAGLTKAYFDAPDDEGGTRALGTVGRGLIVVVLGNALWVSLLAIPLLQALAGVGAHETALCVVGAAAIVVAGVPEGWMRIRERAFAAAGWSLATFASNVVFGLLFVLALQRGYDGAIAAPVAGALLMALASAALVLRLPREPDVKAATWRAVVFSLPLVPHYLATWLQGAGDRWVISAFGADADLGIYYLAVQIASPLPMLVSAWNSATWPGVGRLARDSGPAALRPELRRLERNALLVSLAPAAAMLALTPVIALMIGERFHGALSLLPTVALCHVVDALYYPSSNVLYFLGRVRMVPVFTVISAILGLGLAALLLPRYGIWGLLVARVAGSTVQASGLAITARVALRKTLKGSEVAVGDVKD